MEKEPGLKPGQRLVPPSAHCTLRFGLVGPDSLLSSYQDSTSLKLEPVHLYQNQLELAEMQFWGPPKSEAFRKPRTAESSPLSFLRAAIPTLTHSLNGCLNAEGFKLMTKLILLEIVGF